MLEMLKSMYVREKFQMNNYYKYSKLLWRPAANVRTIFHLLRDRHYYSAVCNRSSNNHHINLLCSSSNANYDDGNFIAPRLLLRKLNNRHRLLTTLKANSQQQHFCTSNTTTKTSSSSDEQTSELPDAIEQQCEQWAQIIRAKWESRVVEEQHSWHGVKLKCTNVLLGLNTSTVFLSAANLSLEPWRHLRQLFQIGKNVELKNLSQTGQTQSDSIGQLDNVLGIVTKCSPDGISIRINRRLNIQEAQLIQRCSFDIRKKESPRSLQNRLNFLGKRHSDWCKWPGYATMLQAFKCQPLQEDTVGLDPTEWVGSHGKDLDPSQCTALSAALNMKRPIVAVHGPPGSGKTNLLVEYLQILRRQGKKVLVVSPSNAGLYHLMGTFCKKFPSVASNNGTFICMKHYDAYLVFKVIADDAIKRLIVKNSLSEMQRNIDEKTRKFYDKTIILKSAMEKRPDLSREDDLMREAEEVSEQMREISHRMKDEKEKHLFDDTSIFFTNLSHSMLNMFTRLGLTFDMVIIDDAARMSEFESWMMALPTAPVLRLFGDYNQYEAPVASSIGRELNFKKSLLQRMDEQFGPEVNFHLQRQYRSNAAIQAWPNRAFYGQRAAEPDESVRNIRLDDLLEEGKSPPQQLITDPLVLVDLGKLEGEWRDGIFKAENCGKSWVNWDEAFLTVAHLWHLFEHIPQLHPSKIASLTYYAAQRNTFGKILSALSVRHANNLKHIRMERSANLQGQQFDVVLQGSVTVPSPDAFTNPYHLKRLSNKMCRARRQFIWFTNSQWLEEGSEQSRHLLRTFREYGRIVGPNQMPQLERGQFWKNHMEVQNRLQKMQERMTMTSKNRKKKTIILPLC